MNFLTIATEFIGVSLALGYFGVSEYISVPDRRRRPRGHDRHGQLPPLGAVHVRLHRRQLPRDPARRARATPRAGPFFHGFAVPGVQGGFNSTSVLLVIAIVGTTVAPWQLFFQQSNIVDKRITPRWINYERVGHRPRLVRDGLRRLAPHGRAWRLPSPTRRSPATSPTPAASPTACSTTSGSAAGTMFAIILLNASIIGAAAVTLSTSYAFGDVFGARHSLHRLVARGQVLLRHLRRDGGRCAAAIVLIPGAPLGLITTGVQALAGVLLPSATVFLLLLCNDKDVLGPWVNRPWLNVVAGRHRLDPADDVPRADGDDAVHPDQRQRLGARSSGGVLLVSYGVAGIVLVGTAVPADRSRPDLARSAGPTGACRP